MQNVNKMTKQKIKFAVIILCSVFFSGCLYYDYGVDKGDYELPYRSYYYYDKDRKIDFVTVLYTLDKELEGANYTKFTVRIAHMEKENFREINKGKYISTIYFSDFTSEDNIQIIPESIKLVHKTLDGRVINCEKMQSDFSQRTDVKYRSYYFRKVYNPDELPKEMIECIFFEVVVDGITEKIEYELPIKKALHYTYWDVMSSI